MDDLLLDICELVEKYSQDENFIYEVEINGTDKTSNEIFVIRLARDNKNSLISVTKSKQCGTAIYSVRKDNGKDNGDKIGNR